MSLLNQISRQVTMQIDLQPSKLFPKGIMLPPDIIEHIVFDYLLPHHWTVPRNLQQDICLLRNGSSVTNCRALIGTLRTAHNGDIHGEWLMVSDESYWAQARAEHGENFLAWAAWEQSRPEGPPVRTLMNSKHRFEIAWSSVGSEEAYGPDHTQIMAKFLDQSNWSKVKILNHMRSVENPRLGFDMRSQHEDYTGRSPDFMELCELTDEDMITAGVSPNMFEDARLANRLSLETTLDEIIRNDQKWQEEDGSDTWQDHGTGALNCLTWIPGINGSGGSISFGRR